MVHEGRDELRTREIVSLPADGAPPPPGPSEDDGASIPPSSPLDDSWLDAQRVRRISAAALTAYVLVTVAFVWRGHDGVDPQGKAFGYDFLAFWSAAKLALAGQASAAYDGAALFARERAAVPKLSRATAWPYPPTFLFVVVPFGLLPYLVGYAAFVIATLAGYAAVVRRILGTNAALLPFLAFSGVYSNALQGQNGFLTGLLMGGALSCLREAPLLAGVLFGALTIKPHLGLLIPFALLASGRGRTFVAAALTALALLAASVLVFGKATLAAFVATLPSIAHETAIGHLPLEKMPTIFALARLAHVPTPAAAVIHGLFAVAAAVAVALIWRRRIDHDLQRAALVSGSLLVSPYLYDYDLAWLALTIAFFVRYALRTGFRQGEREMLLALWLLPFSVVLLQRTLHVHVAPLLLLGGFAMIARRAVQDPHEEPSAA